MTTLKKKRKMSRDEFDTPVTYSADHFTTHHKAMMHNFSEDGLYFESKDPIAPGTEVFVKTANLRSVNRCEVKWCSKIDDDDAGSDHFGVGLQCK